LRQQIVKPYKGLMDCANAASGHVSGLPAPP